MARTAVKFKVGDKVQIKKGHEAKCGTGNRCIENKIYSHTLIIEVNSPNYSYNFVDNKGKSMGGCLACYYDEDFELMEEGTEEQETDDVIRVGDTVEVIDGGRQYPGLKEYAAKHNMNAWRDEGVSINNVNNGERAEVIVVAKHTKSSTECLGIQTGKGAQHIIGLNGVKKITSAKGGKKATERTLKQLIKTTINITDSNQIVGQDRIKKQLGVAIKRDMPVLLQGHTGTGKTSIVRELAKDHKASFSRFNLTGETTVDEFVGKYTLKDGNTEWIDGMLLQAMRKGHWLVVDEINVALPEILFVLHSLLDDDKFVVVPQKDGEIVKPHPDFRFFGTMNPVDEYAGTKDLNKAFKSRFNMLIEVDYPEADVETQIVLQKTGVEEEQARMIVDLGQLARQAKADDKIFYTCSTRDLIQWGHLVKDMPMAEAFELAILGKANGDGEEVKNMYNTLDKGYKTATKKGYRLNIDHFNTIITRYEDEKKNLDDDRKKFNSEKEGLVEQVKEDTIRKLLKDANIDEKSLKATIKSAKKPTPKKSPKKSK